MAVSHQKPWSVDYFEQARSYMTTWVKNHLLPYINNDGGGHSKIAIKAPVKSGKREIVEYVAQRDSVTGNAQVRVHAFISSWHRTADADQRTELGQQNLTVFSTTNYKNVEACKAWIRSQLVQRKTVVIHLDECDYGSGPFQMLSNLWYFIRDIRGGVVKVILYSATPEEVIYASAMESVDEQQRELLNELLITTQLTYTPPAGYCGSARFISEGLVQNAIPFFERKETGIIGGKGAVTEYQISQQGCQILEEFHTAVQANPKRNFIVLRLSYAENGTKTEHKALHKFLNNLDTFSELYGFSVIVDKDDGAKFKKSTKVQSRADRIEWSEPGYWADLAEGRKFMIVIDQKSSRSTEWACHDRIYCMHDFRHTVQYTTVSQAQERVNHYEQRYGNTFQPIKVYGHLPTFQLSAGIRTHDKYFQNEWERRKVDARVSGDAELYVVRERVSPKRRHPECPEIGMSPEDSTRLLQRLGCCADISISSRVAGKPKQVPEYEGRWYAASKETWQPVWEGHCTCLEIAGITRSNVRNPFANAEANKCEDGRWRGQHRGWRVLKWNCVTNQLFDIDALSEEPKRIEDLGSTGGERNKVCYNENGELGVLIVRPTGNHVIKNQLVSVNTMYSANSAN